MCGGYFYNYQCSMSSHLLSWALNIRWPFSTHTSSICIVLVYWYMFGICTSTLVYVLVYWYMFGICTSTLWAPNTRWGLWCVVRSLILLIVVGT